MEVLERAEVGRLQVVEVLAGGEEEGLLDVVPPGPRPDRPTSRSPAPPRP
ncbi:MAG: hypothetical protein ACRDPY_47595 [Streptosporangiaceae bacterium]